MARRLRYAGRWYRMLRGTHVGRGRACWWAWRYSRIGADAARAARR